FIEPAYKVSGGNGPMVYSGTICSLEKPFKVTVTNAFITFDITFIPSESDVVYKPNKIFPLSDRPPYSTGLFSYAVPKVLLHMSGNGTYSLNTVGDNTAIVCNESSEAHGPRGIGSSGKGAATIQLTPLMTSECDGK